MGWATGGNTPSGESVAFMSANPKSHEALGVSASSRGAHIMDSEYGGPTAPVQTSASFWRKHFAGWRFGVLRSLVLMSIALVANAMISAVLGTRFELEAGSAIIYQGDCQAVRAADMVVHLTLNVLSTIVLAASTYCMEGLCSPTRREVDKAHMRRQWVNIGSQSLRNLRSIGWTNVVCWVLLGFASIPFHWVFNASFYFSRQASQYTVALVTEDFWAEGWSPNATNSSPSLFDQDDYFVALEQGRPSQDAYFRKNDTAVLEFMSDVLNAGDDTFERLDNRACIEAYAVGLLRGRNNVLVVTNSSSSNPVLWSRYPMRHLVQGEANPDPFAWICHDLVDQEDWIKEENYCEEEAALRGTDNGLNWTIRGHPVSHCLSQPAPMVCKLYFNIYIMVIVIVFVFISEVVMLYMSYVVLFRKADDNLRTMGDAIASFLQREDESTSGMCLVTKDEIEKEWRDHYDPIMFQEKKKMRWIEASSRREWWTIFSITLFLTLLLTACVVVAQDGTRRSKISDGLGFTAQINALTSITRDSQTSSTIVPTILVANIPHIAFSIVYLLYTGLFVRLLAAVEWRSYSTERKPLRVSQQPQGEQKSTRMLGLPGRYATAIMALGALSHWLLSMSLFLVRVDGVNSHGTIDDGDLIARLGYSSQGVLLVVVVLIVALAAAIWMGWFRWVNGTMPGDGVNSATISAACHMDGFGSHLGQVMWGDVDITDEYSDVGHCSFSDGPVYLPRERRYF